MREGTRPAKFANLTVKTAEKLHRAQAQSCFLETLIEFKCPPKWTRIPERVLRYVEWNKSTIHSKRMEHLHREYEKSIANVKLLTKTFDDHI